MTFHPRHQDYYSRLGVTEEATLEEIRQAFRRRAKEFHPDLNPSPEANDAFLAIHDAYDVLRDEERRRDYDDFRDDDLEAHDVAPDEGVADEAPLDDALMQDALMQDAPLAEAPIVAVRRGRPRMPAWFAALGVATMIGAAATFGLTQVRTAAPQPTQVAATTPVVQAAAAPPPVVEPGSAARVAPVETPPVLPVELHPAPVAAVPAPAAPPPLPKETVLATAAPAAMPPLPAMESAGEPHAPTLLPLETSGTPVPPSPVRTTAAPAVPPRVLHPRVPVARVRYLAAVQAARARMLAVQAYRARLAHPLAHAWTHAWRPAPRTWRRRYAVY